MSAPRLPVRLHLRPQPRLAAQVANVPPEVRARAAAFFGAFARNVLVFERIDLSMHPKGSGYDFVGTMPLVVAEALEVADET